MSKEWVNYVGEICTSKSGDKKYIKIFKKFKALCKNNIRLQKYSEYIDSLCEKGIIKTEEERDKKLARAIENGGWVSYVMHVPPQEFKGESPEVKGEWINNALDIRQTAKGDLNMVVNVDFEVDKGQVIFLKNVVNELNKLLEDGKITQKTHDERLDKLRLTIKNEDGENEVVPNKFWLLFKGDIPPKKDIQE